VGLRPRSWSRCRLERPGDGRPRCPRQAGRHQAQVLSQDFWRQRPSRSAADQARTVGASEGILQIGRGSHGVRRPGSLRIDGHESQAQQENLHRLSAQQPGGDRDCPLLHPCKAGGAGLGAGRLVRVGQLEGRRSVYRQKSAAASVAHAQGSMGGDRTHQAVPTQAEIAGRSPKNYGTGEPPRAFPDRHLPLADVLHGPTTMKNKAKPSAEATQSAPTLSQQFSQFAHAISLWTGHPLAFLLAVAIVLVWIVTGPFFNFSDTWQLIINTGTTIVTFLMVFLIQNTQNRD